MKRFMMVLVLALCACGGKKEDSKDNKDNKTGSSAPAGSSTPSGSGSATTPQAGSGSATAQAGSGSGSAADAGSGGAVPMNAQVDVPTEADFEQEASTRITDQTLEAELKSVETDLQTN